jgi:hypothetical protein
MHDGWRAAIEMLIFRVKASSQKSMRALNLGLMGHSTV